MDSPIVKATGQSAILAAISSVIGQLISRWQPGASVSLQTLQHCLSLTEIIHFAIVASFTCPPNYIWQAWLEAQFPGYSDSLTPLEKEAMVDDVVRGSEPGAATETGRGDLVRESAEKKAITHGSTAPRSRDRKLNLRNTAIKFTLDQTIGAAANTILFVAGLALLRGYSTEMIFADLRLNFWPMILAGQKLWPAVSLVSLTVVPVEQRTLFNAVAGLFWGVYLSLMSSSKDG